MVKYSKEQRRQIISLRNKGLTFPEIAQALGIEHSSSLWRICNKEFKDHFIDESLRSEILRLREQGLTYPQIAEKVGRSIGACRSACVGVGATETPAQKRDKQIIELRKEGLLYDEIAERLSVPKGIVQRVCNTNGFSYSREEQSNVAHDWSVNHRTNYHDSSVEIIKSRIPDYIEYVGGYEGSDGYINVKCKNCGTEFERSVQTVRKTGIAYCPVCRHRELEANRVIAEQKKQAELAEANKRREEERERAKLEKAEERKRKIKVKTCVICGQSFETTNGRAKCCSVGCSKVYQSKRHDRRFATGERNKAINARSLFKRDDGTCWICGGKCNLNDYVIRDGAFIAGDWYPSVDHIFPVYLGGSDTWDNVKLAHRLCNRQRYIDEKDSRRKKFL